MKEPLKILKITTGFSEDKMSRHWTFKTLDEADKHFSRANYRAQRENAGYYKTDFTIHFTNGETYSGRFDIGADAPTLTDHVISFCKYAAEHSLTHWEPVLDCLTNYKNGVL
jgi:hypothetical protein